jgi:Flp pilus assembly protein TadG
MAKTPKLKLVSCNSGTTAVEFALVLPPFLMLFLGILSASVAVFAAASLHYAVEGAARCNSVNSTLCSTATATQSYAQTLYKGLSSPVIFGINSFLRPSGWTIPFSAKACFP